MGEEGHHAQDLPHFLVIGAEKAGTTWLYQALRKHPDIFLPNTKEIHFFNTFNSLLEPVKHFELGVNWYKRFFRKSRDHQLLGEVTPMYLADPVAADRIAHTLPDVRLIYMLREPVSRAYSHYWMARRKGLIADPFKEVIAREDPRFIARGYYSTQLRKYLQLFPKNQILGLEFERFFEDRDAGLRTVLKFLNVDCSEELVASILSESEGFVGIARTPRSVRAHQLISRLSKTLRNTHGGSQLMDLIKGTRISQLKDLNFRQQPYEPITKEDADSLRAMYQEDILQLRELVDFSVRRWIIN